MPYPAHAIETDTTSALTRLKRLSKPFTVLFSSLTLGMIVLSVTLALAALVYDGPHVRVSDDLLEAGQGQLMVLADLSDPQALTTQPISDLPLGARVLFVINLALLQWGALAMIFFYCRTLFQQYETGTVFSDETVASLRHIALWLVIWSVAPAVGHQIASFSGFVDQGWLRASSVGALLFGGVLFVLAKVIDLGREIERDRAGYI